MESNNGVPERSMSRRLKKVRQKLTPEEKQRRKELRLAKKILQQKTLIRDRYEREVKYSKTTAAKTKEVWNICMESDTLKQLINTIPGIYQDLNVMIAKKDHKIDQLMHHLTEAEHTHQRSFQQHIEIINYMLNVHNLCIGSLHKIYDLEASMLLDDYRQEKTYKKEVFGARRKTYENVQHNRNVLHNQMINTIANYSNDFAVNSTLDLLTQKSELRDRTLKQVDELFQQLKKIPTGILHHSRAKQLKEFKELMDKENATCRILESVAIDSEKYEVQRIQTEDKLRSMEMGHIHQMNNLNFERKSFQDFFKKQKRNVDKLYKSDKTKILHLADIATTTIRKLKEKLKECENLLLLHHQCKRYKTELEKILPLGTKINCEDEFDIDEQSIFVNFFERCGEVKAQNAELKHEKRYLLKHNKNLQEVLRYYCRACEWGATCDSLELNFNETVKIVTQEASQIPQLKRVGFKRKPTCFRRK